MWNSNKLNGFTLVETMVALTISMFIVSFSGGVYLMVNKQVDQFKRMNDRLLNAAELDYWFYDDFRQGHRIEKTAEGIRVYKNESGPVTYKFNERVVVREMQGRSDTFKLQVQGLRTSLADKEQHINGRPVDRLLFSGRMKGKQYRFVYRKRYSAAEKMAFEEQ